METAPNIIKSRLSNTIRWLKIYSGKNKQAEWLVKHYLPGTNRFVSYHKMKTFYSQFVKKGDLCFDIGANIGNRTEIFLDLGARVIAVEPQAECLKTLRQLFGGNRHAIIVDKAVGDNEGVAEIAICDEAPVISTMSAKWRDEGRFAHSHQWTRTQQVPVTTLDLLIEQYGLPAFCKIDVEGFEETVLKGLTKPIPYLSFEFNIELFEETKRCITRLASADNVRFNCSLGESMELLLPNWVAAEELEAKLAGIDDKLLWGDVYVKSLAHNS